MSKLNKKLVKSIVKELGKYALLSEAGLSSVAGGLEPHRNAALSPGGYHVDYGCGIRGLKGEKTGYAYAETTDFASLKSAARAAASIAVNAGCGTSGPQNFASLHGSQLLKTSGDAGPLPLPSEAGPSLLRSRGWLRFSAAVAACAGGRDSAFQERTVPSKLCAPGPRPT